MHVLSVLYFFIRTLQKFHLDVLKVDQVLYMLQCNSSAIVAYCSCWRAVHRVGSGGMKCSAATGARSDAGSAGMQQPRPSDASTAPRNSPLFILNKYRIFYAFFEGEKTELLSTVQLFSKATAAPHRSLAV